MLYKKYRPKFFKEVVGQEIIIKILKNYLKQLKPPHGYLFAGERGTGKTTVARIYARALNCLNLKNLEPCDECKVCKLFNENKFLDIIEIDAASHRKIENIRNLQEHIGFKPLQGKYKVFIIDEAHSLTEEASNALLKTLEEPPAHTIFILATTEPERILPTIRSRLQRLDFRRINLPLIVKKLKYILDNEKIDYEEGALNLIAEESGGSLRDAETLLEKLIFSLNENEKLTEDLVFKYLGSISQNKILEFLSLISDRRIEESLSFLAEIYHQGFDLHLFVKFLIKTIREIILTKLNENYLKHLQIEKQPEIIEKIKNLGNKLTLEDLKRLSNIFLEVEFNLKKEPPSPLFLLELALIEYFIVK